VVLEYDIQDNQHDSKLWHVGDCIAKPHHRLADTKDAETKEV
jgi:hypothetical protein